MKTIFNTTALVAGLFIAPMSALADPVHVSDFELAPRIAEGVAAGEPLDILVSYSRTFRNEFAPFIRAGVRTCRSRRWGKCTLCRPGRSRRGMHRFRRSRR